MILESAGLTTCVIWMVINLTGLSVGTSSCDAFLRLSLRWQFWYRRSSSEIVWGPGLLLWKKADLSLVKNLKQY